MIGRGGCRGGGDRDAYFTLISMGLNYVSKASKATSVY
jgi:hypothetical protein